jgi:hypothetical protein
VCPFIKCRTVATIAGRNLHFKNNGNENIQNFKYMPPASVPPPRTDFETTGVLLEQMVLFSSSLMANGRSFLLWYHMPSLWMATQPKTTTTTTNKTSMKRLSSSASSSAFILYSGLVCLLRMFLILMLLLPFAEAFSAPVAPKNAAAASPPAAVSSSLISDAEKNKKSEQQDWVADAFSLANNGKDDDKKQDTTTTTSSSLPQEDPSLSVGPVIGPARAMIYDTTLRGMCCASRKI